MASDQAPTIHSEFEGTILEIGVKSSNSSYNGKVFLPVGVVFLFGVTEFRADEGNYISLTIYGVLLVEDGS